jgi:hypothetical protein
MNIFYLDKNPETCARMHVDKHVVKMIVEYAQLLSTAHRMIDGHQIEGRSKTGRRVKRWVLSNPNKDAIIYKAVHYYHPSAVWARETKEQYLWLYDFLKKLGQEYTHRYGKVHSTNFKLNQLLSDAPVNIKQEGWREPPPAMSHYPQCIVPGDSIKSYHNYYNEAKAYFAKWTKREQPDWFIGRVA